MGYAKLFSTITESSLWSEPKEVRLLFVTMLAKANSVGFVEAAIPGLSRAANLTIEEVQKALPILESPDPFSKNPDHEGRRIVPAPGGWVVLNYEEYRSRQSEEERREYMREYMRRYRKQSVNKVNGSKEFPSASVVASVSVSKSKPTLSDLVEFFGNEVMANDFWDYYESNGWRVGRNPMRDWKSSARRWKRNNGTNQKHTSSNPRIAGTALEGTASRYRDVGKLH